VIDETSPVCGHAYAFHLRFCQARSASLRVAVCLINVINIAAKIMPRSPTHCFACLDTNCCYSSALHEPLDLTRHAGDPGGTVLMLTRARETLRRHCIKGRIVAVKQAGVLGVAAQGLYRKRLDKIGQSSLHLTHPALPPQVYALPESAAPPCAVPAREGVETRAPPRPHTGPAR
jgi:hypothetical protein